VKVCFGGSLLQRCKHRIQEICLAACCGVGTCLQRIAISSGKVFSPLGQDGYRFTGHVCQTAIDHEPVGDLAIFMHFNHTAKRSASSGA